MDAGEFDPTCATTLDVGLGLQARSSNERLDQQRQEALDALSDLVIVQRQGEERQAQLTSTVEALQRSAAIDEVWRTRLALRRER